MLYVLSNYPLLTYADRAKQYFLKALEIKPADQFLHIHILIVYMTLWDGLSDEEKGFVRERYEKMTGADPKFPKKLEDQWVKSFGSADRLQQILAWLQQLTENK
jgi:hypothetical protein